GGQVQPAVVLAGTDVAHHVAVDHGLHDRRLAVEAVAELGIVHAVGAHELERHVATVGFAGRLVDLAHAAGTDAPADAEAGDPARGQADARLGRRLGPGGVGIAQVGLDRPGGVARVGIRLGLGSIRLV